MGETITGGLYAERDAAGKILSYKNGKGEPVKAEDLPEGVDGVAKPLDPTSTGADTTKGKDGDKPTPKTFGELPAGYPGAEAFVAAGLTTRAVVEGKTDQELKDLRDIGTATVANVREFAKNNPLTAS